MNRLRIIDIQKMINVRPIVCLTAYTVSVTKAIESYVDILLIGDSLGTTIYGMNNTQSVTMDMMERHGKAVVQSSKKPFTIIDMPYASYRNYKKAFFNASKLIKKTGCQSVKIEVNEKDVKTVSYLTKKNVRVVSHIGVKPQAFSNFSKIKAVGKSKSEKIKLLNLALQLEAAGSCMLLLECVYEETAKEITSMVNIPTIGIGSSIYCDGQILVINDVLGLNPNFHKPKFVKTYTNLPLEISKSVKKYSQDIKKRKFPSKKYTYR